MITTNICYTPLQSAWRFVSIPCLCLAGSIFLTGCGTLKYAGAADSNYSQVVRTHILPACSGRAVVVTPDKQDDFVYSELPTTLGGIGYFETPLGKVIRNRSEDVFCRIFSSENQSGCSEAKYIITPVYKKFTYGVAFSQVLTMVLDMEVIVKKEDGTIVYREQFHETGRVNLNTASTIASSSMIKDFGEATTFEIDKLVFNTMLKAANNTVIKIASTRTEPLP